MFYELTTSESQDFPVPAAIAEAGEFPSDLVNLIKNYKPIEMKGLQEEIEDTKRQIVALRNEMTTDKDWKSEFKNSLDEHNRQLGLLIEGLKDEKEVRRQDDNLIVGRLDSLSSYFTAVRLGWAVIAIIVAAIVGGFVTKFIFH